MREKCGVLFQVKGIEVNGNKEKAKGSAGSVGGPYLCVSLDFALDFDLDLMFPALGSAS